jgi:hypothetical protein
MSKLFLKHILKNNIILTIQKERFFKILFVSSWVENSNNFMTIATTL